MLALVFLFLQQFNAYLLIAADRQGLASTYTIVVGILNVIANLIFIPRWGIVGAALASLVAYASYFVAQVLVPSSRVYSLTLARLALRPTVATAVTAAVVLFALERQPAPSLVLGPPIYFTALWLLGGIDLHELRTLATTARVVPEAAPETEAGHPL